MQKQLFMTRQSLELTQAHQQRLTNKWNKVISDPYAFTPHEKKGHVTLKETTTQNRNLGTFACDELKKLFKEPLSEEKDRRIWDERKVVGVGFGRSYDSQWLQEATKACYQTWWIDVSDVACALARKSMGIQTKNLPPDVRSSRPIVQQGEIRSVLADPSTIRLDLSTVEIWYFCRTLTCLSKQSAKIVLEQLGECSLSLDANPDRKNAIMIVAALRDDNPHRIGSASKLYTMREIITQVQRGAKQQIHAEQTGQHYYFDQLYSSIILRSK